MQKQTIGIVGLGRMGGNMARRLRECGYSVGAVYDIAERVRDALAKELGATACRTPAEVTAASDVILTVVTDDDAMASVFYSEDGLLENAEGKIFVNCATLSPHVHRTLEERAKRVGAETLEACMASSIPQARKGELFFIVSGPQATCENVRPLLDDLSAELRYVGASGRASEVKALVNLVMNINTAALAEGLGIGASLDLDLDLLRDIFSRTGAASRVLETDGEDMVRRDHECFFSAEHAAKDCGIAMQLGQMRGLHSPLAAATLDQYRRMVEEGLGGLDKSGVAELTFPGRAGSARAQS